MSLDIDDLGLLAHWSQVKKVVEVDGWSVGDYATVQYDMDGEGTSFEPMRAEVMAIDVPFAQLPEEHPLRLDAAAIGGGGDGQIATGTVRLK